MGIPALEGYYVTHDWEEGTMSFVPHKDSERAELKNNQSGPIENMFKVKMESENAEDAEIASVAVAAVVSLLCLAATGAIVYAMHEENTGNG